MILLWILLVPIIAGVLAWPAARISQTLPRVIALAAAIISLGLTFLAWFAGGGANPLAPGPWTAHLEWPWIPEIGVHFELAMDGLSFLLVALTFFIGVLAVLSSWREIREGVGFFHLNLSWILAGIAGVFLAMDLFLFYVAWEVMLVPMYFLIAIWGHERRLYAAVKFFIFTQLSGLLMLVAILALAFAHRAQTGTLTFRYADLLGTVLDPYVAMWVMLGFFIAFAVKLPMVPLHTWLADAHTEAPTAGSVILAALMLKTGGYGLLRFIFPLFPDSAREFAPIAMSLAVAGILYGAIQAFAQTDLKRLVAYTSVSHLGFVLLGAFAWNELALQGVVVTMIAHGLSTGALFITVGALQERMHTREMDRMSGLWATAPFLGGSAMVFTMASLGLPGLADFVGEFLVLLGTYPVTRVLAIFAAIGVLMNTLYGMKLIQRTFHGPNVHNWAFPDVTPREAFIAAVVIAALIWIGIYPVPIMDTFRPALQTLQLHAMTAMTR